MALAADREMNFWEARPLVDRFRFKRRRNRVDRGVENAASSMITTYNSTQTHKLWIFVFIYLFFMCLKKEKRNEARLFRTGNRELSRCRLLNSSISTKNPSRQEKPTDVFAAHFICGVVWTSLCLFFFSFFLFIFSH